MIDLLIVGGGSIGERHVRCFLSTGRVRVHLVETDERKGEDLASRYSIDWHPNYLKALAVVKPEAVLIATPAPLHIDMALEAMKRQCHLLIEKPLSVFLTGTDALLERCRNYPKVVAVAYFWRCHPALREAADVIQSGKIGDVHQVLASFGQDFASLRPNYAETYYAGHKSGGGAIQDGLTHVANAVEMLVGPMISLVCFADRLALEGVEVEDSAGVVARAGKAIVVYSYSQVQQPNEFQIDVHGSKGSLRVEMTNKRLGHFRSGQWHYKDTPYSHIDVVYTEQANAFLDAIAGKREAPCTVPEAMHTLRFNLACLESMRKKEVVTL